MEDNKWMIVKKEKISTKIKNYFKNVFSKILNTQNKKKTKTAKKQKQEVIIEEKIQPISSNIKKDKDIIIEFEKQRKPKEIVIEYEKKNRKKQIVVEYENKKSKQKPVQIEVQSKPKEKKTIQVEMQNKTKTNNKEIYENTKKYEPKTDKKVNVKQEPKIYREEKVQELALKPVRAKKEKKGFNIFQLFKDKERKKRKEILNRIRENKIDDYETISTKTKLSKGSIAVDDVDANELDPLIDLYRDSNKKLRNRIRESQIL